MTDFQGGADAYEGLIQHLRQWAQGAVNVYAQHTVSHMTTRYMRDAKGEHPVREASDKGPLRIVTGRLVRSFIGSRVASGVHRATGSLQHTTIDNQVRYVRPDNVRTSAEAPEGIRELTIQGGRVTLTLGSKVPYAAYHEFGSKDGSYRGRPYFRPALKDAEASARPVILKSLNRTIQQYLGAATKAKAA